jgi:hypothetical protein
LANKIFDFTWLLQDGFAEGYVNDQLVFGVRMPDSPASGFPAFGTAGFGHADFDYIMISESWY